MDNEPNVTQEAVIDNQVDMLEQYANAMLEKESQTLRELVDIVAQATSISRSSTTGKISTNINLGAFELEALVLRIPAECLRLQGLINMYSTRNTFKDLTIEGKVTKALADLNGEKGTVEERKKKAEMTCLDEKRLNQVNKMMIRGLQGYIDRADKVYEGVKKIMDTRGKEGYFDRKGPN